MRTADVDIDAYIMEMAEELEMWTDLVPSTRAHRVAVGTSGEIWQWDGDRWEQLPSPTKSLLYGIVDTGRDGECVAYGADSTVISGSGQHWNTVEVEGAGVWGVTEFRSAWVNGRSLRSTDNWSSITIHAVSADASQLLLLGQDRLLRSEDGMTFSRIV